MKTIAFELNSDGAGKVSRCCAYLDLSSNVRRFLSVCVRITLLCSWQLASKQRWCWDKRTRDQVSRGVQNAKALRSGGGGGAFSWVHTLQGGASLARLRRAYHVESPPLSNASEAWGWVRGPQASPHGNPQMNETRIWPPRMLHGVHVYLDGLVRTLVATV